MRCDRVAETNVVERCGSGRIWRGKSLALGGHRWSGGSRCLSRPQWTLQRPQSSSKVAKVHPRFSL